MKHGDGWQPSTVLYLLRDRRVLGELQPMTKVNGRRRPVGEPVLNYFPPAIDADLFYAVQSGLQHRWTGASSARSGSVPNLFVGISRCECGRRMEYRDKRIKRGRGARQEYLMCSGRRRSARLCANSNRYTYADVETSLLEWVTDIEIVDEDAHNSAVIGINLRAKERLRDDLARRIADALSDRENETDPDFRRHFMARARSLKSELGEVETEIEGLSRAVIATQRSAVEDRRLIAKQLRNAMTEANPKTRFALRAKLAAAIRQTISGITFSADGRHCAVLHGGSKDYLFEKDVLVGVRQRVEYRQNAELAPKWPENPALASIPESGSSISSVAMSSG